MADIVDSLFPDGQSEASTIDPVDSYLDRFDFEQQPVENRSALGFLGASVGRGAAGLLEGVGKGLQAIDSDAIGPVDSLGSNIRSAGERMMRSETLRPDVAESTGEIGFVKRKVGEGIQSLGPSLAPFATGLLAGVATGNPFVGFGVGAATLGEIFGGGTYQDRMEKLARMRPDMPMEERHKIALIDSGIEVGGEVISDAIAMATGGLAGKLGTKAASEMTVKALLKSSPTKFVKNFAKGLAPELLTETAQAKYQSDLDVISNTGDALTWAEAAKEVAIPTIVMFGVMHSGASGLNVVQKRAILKGINSENPQKRLEAAKAIESKIDDPEVKQAWREYAGGAIVNGTPINITEDITAAVDPEKLREKADILDNETDELGFQTVDQVIESDKLKKEASLSELADLDDYLIQGKEADLAFEPIAGAMESNALRTAQEANRQGQVDRNQTAFLNEIERQAYNTYQPELPNEPKKTIEDSPETLSEPEKVQEGNLPTREQDTEAGGNSGNLSDLTAADQQALDDYKTYQAETSTLSALGEKKETPVKKPVAGKKESTGIRVRLDGQGPQVFEVVRKEPATEADLPGESFYTVRNVKTGEEQVIDNETIIPIKGSEAKFNELGGNADKKSQQAPSTDISTPELQGMIKRSLSDIMVRSNVLHEESGKVVQIEETADVALKEVDGQLEKYRKLLDCLAS